MTREVLDRVHRAGRIAVIIAAFASLAGCAAAAPAPLPPRIEQTGIVTGLAEGRDFVRYTFRDGSTRKIDPQWYRQLTENGWGGFGLLVLGDDQHGPFVASFMPQGGLPADCYVGNGPAVERGDYVEMWGVLWEKAPGFATSVHPADGSAYTSGTRFCFNAAAQPTKVVSQ